MGVALRSRAALGREVEGKDFKYESLRKEGLGSHGQPATSLSSSLNALHIVKLRETLCCLLDYVPNECVINPRVQIEYTYI